MKYTPEKYFVRFIGFLETNEKARLKVFSTVSRKHVLMYPETLVLNQRAPIKSVRVKNLDPDTRRLLGC
jgi:hypothetical protein